MNFKSLIKQYVAEAVEELVNEGLLDKIDTRMREIAKMTPADIAAKKVEQEKNWAARVKAKNPPQPVNPQGYTFYKDLEKGDTSAPQTTAPKPSKVKPTVTPTK